MTVNVTEVLDIDRILEYSVLGNPAQLNGIAADGFESYDNILTLGGSDIVNLSKGFSNRTSAAGKIIFGLIQTNPIIATIHWDQYFRSNSRTPSLFGINNATKFRTLIEAIRHRDRIRRHSIEQPAGLIKAVDPVNLKRHKE